VDAGDYTWQSHSAGVGYGRATVFALDCAGVVDWLGAVFQDASNALLFYIVGDVGYVGHGCSP